MNVSVIVFHNYTSQLTLYLLGSLLYASRAVGNRSWRFV